MLSNIHKNEITKIKGDNCFGYATGWYEEERGRLDLGIKSANDFNAGLIEVSCLKYHELAPTIEFLNDYPHSLDLFKSKSLHAPTGGGLNNDSDWLKMINEINEISELFERIIFHPEIIPYKNEEVVQGLRDLGMKLVIENMDIRRNNYKTVSDLEEVFQIFPRAGLCLDVAHVWTVDKGMKLGEELVSKFHDRIEQIHLSGIHENGHHREMVKKDFIIYDKVLKLVKNKPWVFESVYLG